MKTTIFPILVLAAATAFADGRIQVSASSTSVRARPDAQSAALGEVRQGTILFPSGSPRGEWTPVEPPADVALWLHGEFVQGSRVIAKSVQLRTGPGLEYDVAGNLSRGATVMTLGEEGEWLKISPPSSAEVWVRTADTSPVVDPTEPIREVEPVASLPTATSPQPLQIAPSDPQSVPAPPPRMETHPTPPRIGEPVAPSQPVTPMRPAPAPVVVASTPHPAPVPTPVTRPAVSPSVSLRPATTIHPRPAPVAQRPAVAPAARPAPAPRPAASASTISVDPALVSQLSLRTPGDAGRPVQVQGELRNAPFTKGSPSHFRLVRRSSGMECLVHGRPEALRPFIGKEVSIRGRAYAVDESDLPVVVVAHIAPAAP